MSTGGKPHENVNDVELLGVTYGFDGGAEGAVTR